MLYDTVPRLPLHPLLRKAYLAFGMVFQRYFAPCRMCTYHPIRVCEACVTRAMIGVSKARKTKHSSLYDYSTIRAAERLWLR